MLWLRPAECWLPHLCMRCAQVATSLRLGDLLGSRDLPETVQLLRCDGHQHMGAQTSPEAQSDVLQRPSLQLLSQTPHSSLL